MASKKTDAGKLLGPSFSLFEKLKLDAEKFEAEPSIYNALDFASPAWHLLD